MRDNEKNFIRFNRRPKYEYLPRPRAVDPHAGPVAAGGRPRDLHATIRLISPGQFNYSERSLIISESFFRVINFFERHGPGAIRREGPAAISRDNADLYGREAAAIRRARARAASAPSGAPARTPLICAGYLRRFMLIDEAESAKPA
ncbi:hypothetical protein EVAR_69356_1 [Eumeta japonica]|uniref:Uncharacterized protein n=1 Tax=Eumeta variegata TaxID=151549 RepID=A0A4C2A236_EUMVA|nr:hypothetical protein EVAR_69356_1 [Eumeta japonica]